HRNSIRLERARWWKRHARMEGRAYRAVAELERRGFLSAQEAEDRRMRIWLSLGPADPIPLWARFAPRPWDPTECYLTPKVFPAVTTGPRYFSFPEAREDSAWARAAGVDE